MDLIPLSRLYLYLEKYIYLYLYIYIINIIYIYIYTYFHKIVQDILVKQNDLAQN